MKKTTKPVDFSTTISGEHPEWESLKRQGSQHYKTGGVEPVDLYLAGGMFHDFALCSIIKYAFRSRQGMNIDNETLHKNLDKIIDYAQKLKVANG
ncbi:MAG: DUF3310 domain-containing protein [Dehalococcoidia bacterium]